MIGQATKRETIPSPLGALLPITYQVYSLSQYFILPITFQFPMIFKDNIYIPTHSFDIFSKTTKVCKLDSRAHLYTIHPYSSQGAYGSVVYRRISFSVICMIFYTSFL